MSPYDVLEITKEATEEEIKAAYRKMARKYHPDENPGDPQAAEKMHQINLAYDLLKNPEQRKVFDHINEDDIFFNGYSFQNRHAPEEYQKPRRNLMRNRTFQKIILAIVVGSMLAVNISSIIFQTMSR